MYKQKRLEGRNAITNLFCIILLKFSNLNLTGILFDAIIQVITTRRYKEQWITKKLKEDSLIKSLVFLVCSISQTTSFLVVYLFASS